LGPGVAYDVNSNGQIAAFINGKPVVTDGVHFQFLPYDAFPYNSAIDDAGDILLNSPSPSGPFSRVVNGSTTLLVLTNSSGVTGRDLNNNRLVCGDYNGGFGNAFRSDIGAVPYVSHANSINNQGTIVGMATTNYTYSQFNPYPHPYAACILSNPAPIFIDTRPRPDTVRDFGGTDDLSEALGINDPGEIVGWYHPVAPGPKRAFRYRGQALEDLGTLGGSNSVATHINSGGVVVGWSGISTNSDQHAFIFTNDTLVDLNSFLPAGSGWVLQMANSINDSGQIVGYGLFQGVQHAFQPIGLFSPVSN